MEDETARVEYPAMLVIKQPTPLASVWYSASASLTNYILMQSSLQPNQAVQTLNDRVRRINRINTEIADWLQVC